MDNRLGIPTILELLGYKSKLHQTELIIVGMIYKRIKLSTILERDLRYLGYLWYKYCKYQGHGHKDQERNQMDIELGYVLDLVGMTCSLNDHDALFVNDLHNRYYENNTCTEQESIQLRNIWDRVVGWRTVAP